MSRERERDYGLGGGRVTERGKEDEGDCECEYGSVSAYMCAQ